MIAKLELKKRERVGSISLWAKTHVGLIARLYDLESTKERQVGLMSNNRLEQSHVAAQSSKVFLVLLLPTLLVALLLCGLSQRIQAGPTRLTGTSMVPNHGFETPSPASWDHPESSSNCEHDWVITPRYEGDHAVAIYGNLSGCTDSQGRWRCYTFTIQAGSPYTFFGWIKADNLSGRALLALAFYSTTSESDLISVFSSTLITGPSDWTRVSTSTNITAPPGTQYARVYCKLIGRGTVGFDDIHVNAVETPTLVISKTDAPDPVRPGQRLVYTITYRNTGNVSAGQVVVTETYDANVTYGGAQPTPEVSSGNCVWQVGTLGPQQSGLIVVAVTVTSPLTHGWILTNLVEIGCAEGVTASHVTTTVVHSSLKVYLPTMLKCYIPPSWYRGSLDKLTFSVAACPASSKDTVYAGTERQGIFRSTDGGATWNYEGGTGSLDIMGLAVHPSDCQTAYAATWKGGVYKRSGTSWLQKKEGLGSCLYSNGAIAIDPTEPLRLYVGVRAAAGASGCGVFVSTNGGDSWARTSLRDKDTGSLFIASRTPYTIYAGTTGGVYVSINGGNTWSALGSGLPYTRVWAVIQTPAGQVYAGTDGKGLYRLEGDEWKSEPILGHTGLTIYGLRYVTDSLYVTTLRVRDGVYRLKNNTWYTFNNGLPQPTPEMYLYQMTSTERRLYIATSSGVWWYPLRDCDP